MKGLTTFGMAAVELTSDAGELLQIASDKKATITMPLSGFYFLQQLLLLSLFGISMKARTVEQDGTATKTGNTYVGRSKPFLMVELRSSKRYSAPNLYSRR